MRTDDMRSMQHVEANETETPCSDTQPGEKRVSYVSELWGQIEEQVASEVSPQRVREEVLMRAKAKLQSGMYPAVKDIREIAERVVNG